MVVPASFATGILLLAWRPGAVAPPFAAPSEPESRRGWATPRRPGAIMRSESALQVSQGDPITTQLLRAFRPCVRCPEYRRFGSARDGGYVMCGGGMLEGIQAAYSFGINGVDDWGVDVSRSLSHIPVFEFDCINRTRPPCVAGGCDLRFYEKCLADGPGESDSTYQTLHQHLLANPPPMGEQRPVEGGDLLLKMDVEGHEWQAFRTANISDLQQMRQIVVEFHWLQDIGRHSEYLEATNRIQGAGFLVAHIHGNNFAPMDLLENGMYMVPDDIEVTFVNKLALPEGISRDCSARQDLLPQDAANNDWDPELPLAELPVEDGPPTSAVGSVTGESDGATGASSQALVQCRFWCALFRTVMALGHGWTAANVVSLGGACFLAILTLLLAAMLLVGRLYTTDRCRCANFPQPRFKTSS